MQSSNGILDIVYSKDLAYTGFPMFFELEPGQFNVIHTDPENFEFILTDDFWNSEEINKEKYWYPSFCTVNGRRVIDTKVKKAWKCKADFYCKSNFIEAFMKKNNLTYVNDESRCELTKYEQNDFTGEHIDRLGDFTCLFFPKGQDFGGGELIFHDERVSGGITCFEPENLKKDVMVIFQTNMMHEVFTVTSGKRYVFKIGLQHLQKYTIVNKEKPLPIKDEYKRPQRHNCNMD